MGLKQAYKKVKAWKAKRTAEREKREDVAMHNAMIEAKVAENKAEKYKAYLNYKVRKEKAEALIKQGRSQTGKVNAFLNKLDKVNQRFSVIDQQFGRMGQTIMGDMGKAPQYKTIRKEGYIHPADRVMGFQAPITTRRVKIKPKVQPIQIQVIQGTGRVKKRKPAGRMVYDPLFGYVRR